MNETFSMDAIKPIGEELELIQQKEDAVSTANSIVVSDKQGYDGAMGFLKNVKSVMSSVKNYWSEPKTKAHESWKAICAKENAMLEPLTNAELIVKKKMGTYAEEQRKIELEIQRKQAEARQIEATRLMQEAAEAEKENDQFGAEVKMAMAQTLEAPENFIGNTKQSGTRENKVLKIVNESLVPAYVNGLCIRPVDMVAVKKLYSLSGKLPDGIILTTETVIVAR